MNLLSKIALLVFSFTVIILILGHEDEIDQNIDIEYIPCHGNSCYLAYMDFLSDARGCLFYDLSEKNMSEYISALNIETFTDIENTGLMHHKFCFSDDHVITGSANPTSNDLFISHNHLLLINSSIVSKKFEEEFNRVKQRKLSYKNNQKEKTEKNKESIIPLNLNENFSLYFCNIHDCTREVIGALDAANKSIHFMTFTFTDFDIAKALVKAKQRGLELNGVIESFQSRKFWQTDFLRNNDINVTIHSGEGFQHNKVFIIDKKTVITGSFNPTKAANSINDEALLIITNKSLAREFYSEYKNILSIAQEP